MVHIRFISDMKLNHSWATKSCWQQKLLETIKETRKINNGNKSTLFESNAINDRLGFFLLISNFFFEYVLAV